MLTADAWIAISMTVAVFAGAWLFGRAVSSVAARWRVAENATRPEYSAPWLWRVMIVLSAPLALWLGPRLSLGLRERIQRELRVAEIDDGLLPHQFMAIAVSLPLVVGVGVLIVLGTVATAMLATSIVALLPWWWLKEAAARQRLEVLRELPMYLDMLTLSLEAGGALSVALKISTERAPETLLRRAFMRVQGDLRAGRSRVEALRALAERLDSPAVTALVAALIQADSSGGSLADVLRAQSEQRLDERFARAEKAAMEAPVKMLGPLVLCIFPCTFIVLAAPIVLRFINLSP
ncbi:MAG: type II secretion system F family protein [Gammaproteobacteria bacterium]|jgi:tight adherence protein C|nr:type II secretion system F family protein [Gammaproteobacteria bacterium]